MPHAVITSPSVEYFDSGIPAALIPPKRVYHPLAATFMETESRGRLVETSSYDMIQFSVSRYIRSISSTVDSFASDICDDPAIKSVLNCRNRGSKVPTNPVIQGKSYVSLRPVMAFEEPNERGSRASSYNPGFLSTSSFEQDHHYSSLYESQPLPYSKPERVISTHSALLPSRLMETHPEPCSQMTQQATAILASMATNSIRCSSTERHSTPDLCVGQKRKSSKTDLEGSPSSQERKKARLVPEEYSNTDLEAPSPCVELKGDIYNFEQHRTRDSAYDNACGRVLDILESQGGPPWKNFDSKVAVDGSNWEGLDFSVDAELELLGKPGEEDSKSPQISNLMRLAHAAALSTDLRSSKPRFSRGIAGVELGAKYPDELSNNRIRHLHNF